MSSNELTVVMNQNAGNDALNQTPLHHAELNALAATTSQTDAGIVFRERALTAQLVVRIRGDLAAASSAVQSAIGVELPERLKFSGNPSDVDGVSLAWISPDEWRLCCPISDALACEKNLRKALSQVPNTSYAVVNNSGGFTMLELSGSDALNLLRKSTAYDIRASRFPVGKVVGTSFAKTSITLLRTGESHWQLWVRRSFADYVWLWVQNAAREYGLKISED